MFKRNEEAKTVKTRQQLGQALTAALETFIQEWAVNWQLEDGAIYADSVLPPQYSQLRSPLARLIGIGKMKLAAERKPFKFNDEQWDKKETVVRIPPDELIRRKIREETAIQLDK